MLNLTPRSTFYAHAPKCRPKVYAPPAARLRPRLPAEAALPRTPRRPKPRVQTQFTQAPAALKRYQAVLTAPTAQSTVEPVYAVLPEALAALGRAWRRYTTGR